MDRSGCPMGKPGPDQGGSMTRPRLRVTSVTIGTARPHDLAHFYAHLLGWPVTAEDPAVPGDPVLGGWAQIRAPEGESGPTLNFEYERHFTRPVWPSVPGPADRLAAPRHRGRRPRRGGGVGGGPGRHRGRLPASGRRPGPVRPGRPPVLPVPVGGGPGEEATDTWWSSPSRRWARGPGCAWWRAASRR